MDNGLLCVFLNPGLLRICVFDIYFLQFLGDVFIL